MFFNNVAVGALHAIKYHGLSRVAIVDFDVHHGNGTEDFIGDNPQILYCSTYQHPLYPENTGPSKKGLIVNASLKASVKSMGFRKAITEYWLP